MSWFPSLVPGGVHDTVYLVVGPRDPEAVLQRMLEILDRKDVVAAQQRLSRGYGRLTVVK